MYLYTLDKRVTLNLLVAASNFPVCYPLYASYLNKDPITFAAIIFVGSASFLSHLVENHKHGMKGIGFSEKTSYILNRSDVLGVGLVTARLTYLFLNKYGLSVGQLLWNNKLIFMASCILPVFNLVSERDKYNPSLRNKYIVTHCIWHVGIFCLMGYALNKFIY